MDEYDFCGWATKANVKCSDGRTIMKDAFKNNDGEIVPMVWNHRHDNPDDVLGHALLQNRDEGVYAYCKFNNTESGQTAKLLVDHGDVNALSIYANQLKQDSTNNVMHGNIREVSLVLAAANPEARIESIMMHGEDSGEEAIIFTGGNLSLYHAEEKKPEKESEEKVSEAKEPTDEKKEEPEEKEKTVQDVIDSMTEEQKNVMYALIGEALQHSSDDSESEDESEPETESENKEGGESEMKHNVFDKDERTGEALSHSDMQTIFADAKRCGSLRDAVEAHEISNDTLMHAITDDHGDSITYGIANVDYLFPDARNLNVPPAFIKRNTDWVSVVMNGVHHTPFSRIKSMFANLTVEDARAKGYLKGHLKTEEVFALLKRTTTPTTVYKKQKMDRDDVLDITDFDVVAWLKSEMRMMLDEEIARAILVGDGRDPSSDDKISELNIRPIWKDDSLYSIRKPITYASGATDSDKAKAFIRAAVKARKDYKGSGNPILFTTEDVLTDCLLIEDTTGRIIYETVDKLATALRVSRIVTVPVMENQSRTEDGYNYGLLGIILNLNDYNVGADKGGAVNMFDDFDIDYNQQKYLIETRCSGALTVPYSAIILESKAAV